MEIHEYTLKHAIICISIKVDFISYIYIYLCAVRNSQGTPGTGQLASLRHNIEQKVTPFWLTLFGALLWSGVEINIGHRTVTDSTVISV